MLRFDAEASVYEDAGKHDIKDEERGKYRDYGDACLKGVKTNKNRNAHCQYACGFYHHIGLC